MEHVRNKKSSKCSAHQLDLGRSQKCPNVAKPPFAIKLQPNQAARSKALDLNSNSARMHHSSWSLSCSFSCWTVSLSPVRVTPLWMRSTVWFQQHEDTWHAGPLGFIKSFNDRLFSKTCWRWQSWQGHGENDMKSSKHLDEDADYHWKTLGSNALQWTSQAAWWLNLGNQLQWMVWSTGTAQWYRSVSIHKLLGLDQLHWDNDVNSWLACIAPNCRGGLSPRMWPLRSCLGIFAGSVVRQNPAIFFCWNPTIPDTSFFLLFRRICIKQPNICSHNYRYWNILKGNRKYHTNSALVCALQGAKY